MLWHDAGTQSSPRTPKGRESSDAESLEAKQDQAAAASERSSNEAAPAVIDTNVTKSGRLQCEEDLPRHQQSDEKHERSAPGMQQERAMADGMSSKPAESKVATDSVRLDTAFRVTGTSTAPLRSPFCSDDGGPSTPRQRAAPPEPAQDARSSLAPHEDSGTVPEAPGQPARQRAARVSFQEEADPPSVAAQSSSSASSRGMSSTPAQGSAGEGLQEESPPPASAAPQMPSWLMAELRSPSRRGLQVGASIQEAQATEAPLCP